MAALDLLGRRGTLRILWELRDGAAQTFRELQAAAELPPDTLNTRLRELRSVDIVDAESGYKLSKLGLQLRAALDPLWEWSAMWAKSLRPEKEK